jgi:hypothetical protein
VCCLSLHPVACCAFSMQEVPDFSPVAALGSLLAAAAPA